MEQEFQRAFMSRVQSAWNQCAPLRKRTKSQSELKSREQFAVLPPIATRIRHRIIEIADLLRLAV